MKDAYSFDADETGAKKSYSAMVEAYRKIFARVGLQALQTEADTGVMGGASSHEFSVPAEIGEGEMATEEGGRTRRRSKKRKGSRRNGTEFLPRWKSFRPRGSAPSRIWKKSTGWRRGIK